MGTEKRLEKGKRKKAGVEPLKFLLELHLHRVHVPTSDIEKINGDRSISFTAGGRVYTTPQHSAEALIEN